MGQVLYYNAEGDFYFDAWGNVADKPQDAEEDPRTEELTDATTGSGAASSDDDELGDDEDFDLEHATGKELKAELARRNAEREENDQIDTAGVKKVGDLRELLRADDEKS